MDAMWVGILQGLLGLAVIVGVFFLVRVLVRNQAHKAQAGLPTEWAPRQSGEFSHQMRFQPPRRGKHSHPSMLSLRVPTASKIDLQITREVWFDRFCKSLGIALEFQTGDRDFDANWYLRGEVDTRLGMLLKHGDLRGQVRMLLNQGFTSLRVDKGWLQADWTGFDPGTNPQPADIAGPLLTAIAAALPTGSSAQTPRQFAVNVGLWTFIIVSACSFVAGIDYPPVRGWDMWRLVLPTAALSWALLAWTAAFALRGHSRSHDRWLLVVLAGLVTCTIGARGVLGWWNGARDSTEVVVRDVAVDNLWTERRKKRTAYLLSVQDWKRPGKSLRYEVTPVQYASLREGISRVEVRTRAGRLGVEWQAGFRLIP